MERPLLGLVQVPGDVSDLRVGGQRTVQEVNATFELRLQRRLAWDLLVCLRTEPECSGARRRQT